MNKIYAVGSLEEAGAVIKQGRPLQAHDANWSSMDMAVGTFTLSYGT